MITNHAIFFQIMYIFLHTTTLVIKEGLKLDANSVELSKEPFDFGP